MRKRRSSKRAKSVQLDKGYWLHNTSAIKAFREATLHQQGGACAVSGVPLSTGCLDHTHSGGVGKDGAVRGVLLSEVNMLEGRYLKLFKKMKLDTKYGIDFADFLISLGTYLKVDNDSSILHHKYMDDFRKQVKRYRKDTLLSKLKTEYGIDAVDHLLARDLVQLYMQAWVDEIEANTH